MPPYGCENRGIVEKMGHRTNSDGPCNTPGGHRQPDGNQTLCFHHENPQTPIELHTPMHSIEPVDLRVLLKTK